MRGVGAGGGFLGRRRVLRGFEDRNRAVEDGLYGSDFRRPVLVGPEYGHVLELPDLDTARSQLRVSILLGKLRLHGGNLTAHGLEERRKAG